ncbi:MAG: LolA-related protein [Rhodospirillales bacterium]
MRFGLTLLWLLIATFLLPRGLAADETWTLPQLMQALAAVTEVDATFSERKEMSVLETPLESSGMLRYRAPDDMEKEVLYPEPMRYAVTRDQIVIDQPGGKRETFPLDRYPLLRVLSESMRATLAGDQAKLEAYYRVALSGDVDDWSLHLEPIDPEIARHVIAITINGRANQVLQVETQESGGDRSVMTISPTVR